MKKMNNKGFTLVEIMIVVAIIGLLAAIAIPSFVKNRNLAQQNRCINNLRMIDGAKQQAAVEMGWVDTTSCDTSANMTNVNVYIKGTGKPTCPSGGTYTYDEVSVNPSCDFSTAHALNNSSDGE
jgi:prepilin-type N-terminal cleavage/methylation domain-containing protein